MSVIKIDPDSLELGQKMKQEIEERLKENGKPSVLEIEHQTNDNFQFIFGKCIDPALIDHSCVIVCFFKTCNNWFVDQIYAEYGDGVSPRISGPYTYEQAKECFYKFAYADIANLVNTHITETDDFKLKQVRYSNLKALNNYLSLDKVNQTLIENYIPKLYSFIKADIYQYDDFNILDDKIEFTFHADMYDVTWYLDYHQKPYKYGWYRSPTNKDGWIQYSREKSSIITYNSLKTIQRCFALQVKNEIPDPFFDKLDNQSYEAELYEQLKILQNAQEYEKVFSDPISFNWFCKFYGFDDKATSPMTKEKFVRLFKDGLPDGFVLGMPLNTGDTGIYQSKDNKWIIGHVGDSSSSCGADRYSFSVLHVSNSEEKAFNLFYKFVMGKEDPNNWKA